MSWRFALLFPTVDCVTDAPLSMDQVTPALIAVLRTLNFGPNAIREALGDGAYGALRRGEPGAVITALSTRAEQVGPQLSVLIRLFLLHQETPEDKVLELCGAELFGQLVAAGILGVKDGKVSALVDVQPHHLGGRDQWVLSSIDASMRIHVPGKNHVLGVGAASLSLIATTPTSPVHSLLDVGAGCGVQALNQSSCAQRMVLTDVHSPAMDFAKATMAGAGLIDRCEFRLGPWFDPVAGERFDRVVANPPFVVGPGAVDHVYRDSGLELDGATELMVRSVADHLTESGSAHLLGAWVHRAGEPWQHRVASWVPDHGVTALVWQRDLVDVEHYVGTWLRDESIDPRSVEGQEKARRWLEFFSECEVTHVGFGYVAIERLDEDAPSEVLVEELPQSIDGFLGAEIEEYFRRCAWLRRQTPDSLLEHVYLLRPTVAREDVAVADTETGMGFTRAALRLTRMDGPHWSHEVDEALASILAGLHPGGLSAREVAELFAMSQGLDEEALGQEVAAALVDLVRHGLVLPAEITIEETEAEREHGA